MAMVNNKCHWAKTGVLGEDDTQNSFQRCYLGYKVGGRALLEVCAGQKTCSSSSHRKQQQHHVSIIEWAEMHITAQAADQSQAGSKAR